MPNVVGNAPKESRARPSKCSGTLPAVSRITVVGAGAWGTAIASHAARRKHAVTLWAHEPDVAREVNESHENKLYLPGITLPRTVRATSDYAEALAQADLVVLVPPSSFLRTISKNAAPFLPKTAKVVVATKGIEEHTLELMSTVLQETLPEVGWDRLGFLSGPNFAKEVANGLPTDSVVASRDAACAEAIQEMLHSPTFRTYTSLDPIGVQVGGAIKNVIAVATGTCDGLGLGLNARAALMTRGLSEMARLGVALGADPLTFMGMAGMGDLVLTCTGDLSRNRTLGFKVAQGVSPAAYVKSQRSVAEGYLTSAAAHELGKKLGVEMPITDQVYRVLHEEMPLGEALKTLLERTSKSELYGIALRS
jgi:glycerol-3-phosphate dehydrogenase (NAD(P)+)